MGRSIDDEIVRITKQIEKEFTRALAEVQELLEVLDGLRQKKQEQQGKLLTLSSYLIKY